MIKEKEIVADVADTSGSHPEATIHQIVAELALL
jgi:hypothetical protein